MTPLTDVKEVRRQGELRCCVFIERESERERVGAREREREREYRERRERERASESRHHSVHLNASAYTEKMLSGLEGIARVDVISHIWGVVCVLYKQSHFNCSPSSFSCSPCPSLPLFLSLSLPLFLSLALDPPLWKVPNKAPSLSLSSRGRRQRFIASLKPTPYAG